MVEWICVTYLTLMNIFLFVGRNTRLVDNIIVAPELLECCFFDEFASKFNKNDTHTHTHTLGNFAIVLLKVGFISLDFIILWLRFYCLGWRAKQESNNQTNNL